VTDKITHLHVKPKPNRGKPLELVRSAGGCRHLRAFVDEQKAELECADCGEKLNPIQYLATMARKLTSWDYEAQRIQKLRAELAERKKCRCLKCGEWTEIRAVGQWELEMILRRNGKL